jgi:hypothetical protein
MSIIEKPGKGFHIQKRVFIGFDVLTEEEKQTVGDVLRDRDHFVASTADLSKVRKLSKSEPVYALSILSWLNIIYKVSGEEIEVLDLMSDAILRRYGPKMKKPKATKNINGVNGSN